MTRIISSTSPQKPSDVVLESPATSAAQVAEAVVRARVAQKSWGENAIARAAALRGCAEGMRAHSAEMAALITREVGKASAEAKGEVARAIAILDYNAQAALDPIGTVIPPTTIMRLVAVHFCPAKAIDAFERCAAVRAKSASARTIAGFCPPISA